MWTPGPKKSISRTWIVQDREFPDGTTPDSNQTHVLTPLSIYTQFKPDSGKMGMRTLTMGSENLNVVGWVGDNSGRAQRELS